MQNIAEEIKQKRSDLKLSQAALAAEVGTNRDGIKDIENGRKRCSAETYLKIMKLAPPKEAER